jgi:hypothetical protein
MLIHCTKQLLDELKIKPVASVQEPLFSWHANLLTINRRKTIVLINNRNRYAVVLHGLAAKHKSDIGSIIRDAIGQSLRNDLIDNDVVDEFLDKSGDLIFTTTMDKSSVSKLVEVCKLVDYMGNYFEPQNLYQDQMSRFASRNPYFINKDMVYPNEEMYKDLESLTNRGIFHIKAIQIKVTLMLNNHVVWRRLIVPTDVSFRQLHNFLQKAFGWENCHMHDFLIMDRSKPFVHVVMNGNETESVVQIPKVLENDVRLAEYMPKFKTIIYRYDFGDNWGHKIEFEDLVFDYDKNYSVCLDGVGNAPPEDVGGEQGYEEFLKRLNDPDHEDYWETKRWADCKLHGDFDLLVINYGLRYLSFLD